MAKRWNVAEAKAQFSKVIRGTSEEAQMIEKHGKEVAVVIGADAYRNLIEASKSAKPSVRMRQFVEVSREISARGGVDLELPPRRPRASPFRKHKT